MDSDFHKIYIKDKDICINPDKPIVIGNNVWIGCRVTVLKGTRIADGCIVAAGSLVHKDCEIRDCVFEGNRVLREKIVWED